MLRPLSLMPRTAGGIGEVEQGGGQCAAEGVEEQVEARIHEAPDVRAGIYSGDEELDRLVYRTETESAEQSEYRARNGSTVHDHFAEHVPTCSRGESEPKRVHYLIEAHNSGNEVEAVEHISTDAQQAASHVRDPPYGEPPERDRSQPKMRVCRHNEGKCDHHEQGIEAGLAPVR